jgi:MFS family permease
MFSLLRRNPVGRRLAIAAVIDATGTGLFMASSTLFLTRGVGLSGAQVGTGLAIAAAVALVTTVPIGMLADRFGTFRVYVLLQLWLATGFVSYTFVDSFAGFVVVASMISTGLGSTVPVLQALVGSLVDADARVGLMALTRSVNNVGYGLGGALATLILVINSRAAYNAVLIADAATFVIAATIIASTRTAATANTATKVRKDPVGKPSLRDNLSFFALAMVNGVLCLYISLLTVGFPLWVVTRTDAPAAVVGPLLVVNTAMTVLLQVRLSHGAESLPGARRAFARAGGVLALACLVTATSAVTGSVVVAIVLLVAGMVFLTLGEIWQAAAQFGSGYALSPEDQRGKYLSVFGLGLNAQRIYGPPVVAGVVAWGVGGWATLAVLLAAAGLAAAVLTGLAGQPRKAAEVTATA